MKALIPFFVALGMAAPAAAQDIDFGEAEYMNSCAQCHGSSGRGGGPMAGFLTGELPDLTRLQADNGGVFPVSHVYSVIEGSVDVGPHGTSEMPAWGMRYQIRARGELGEFSAAADWQAFTRTRILALIAHLSMMQEE